MVLGNDVSVGGWSEAPAPICMVVAAQWWKKLKDEVVVAAKFVSILSVPFFEIESLCYGPCLWILLWEDELKNY